MDRDKVYEGEYIEVAARANVADRAGFIRRTYQHVAGAILALLAIETALFTLTDLPEQFFDLIVSNQLYWFIVLGLFMAGSYFATSLAESGNSESQQYAGLIGYVTLEALILMPIIYQATEYFEPSLLPTAAIITLGMFLGLTLTAFTLQKDFSFMGGFLRMAFFAVLGIIVASILFGFELGTLFSAALILLLAGSILYQTSNVMYHYRTDQHVAASLALFASIATLFWYVLQLLMSLNRD